MRQTRKEISIEISQERMNRACEICNIFRSVETGDRKIGDLDHEERALYEEHLPTWKRVYAETKPLIVGVRNSTMLSGKDYNIIVY